MVVTRIEVLEEELRDLKKAYDKEEEAHNGTIQKVIDLRIQNGDLKRKQKLAEGDTQLLVLKCKLWEEGYGKGDGEMGAVHTDHEALQALLPDAPVHRPGANSARSTSHPKGPDNSPSIGPELDGYVDHLTHGHLENNISDFIRGTKLDFDEIESDEFSNDPARSKKPGGQRVVVCIKCYQHKLRCDPGEPCRNCAAVGRVCKRAMCKDYENGTCRRASCLRAHRKDEQVYRNIVQAGHMPRTDPSKPLKPTVKRQRKDDDDDNGNRGLKNSRVGRTGTSLALQY